MKDREFLLWLAERLVYVYRESPNVDFVLKLKAIAEATPKNRVTNFWESSPMETGGNDAEV